MEIKIRVEDPLRDVNVSFGASTAQHVYLRSVRAKVYWTEQRLKQSRSSPRDIYVFTDTDVVPLGSYWSLAERYFTHEIQFMGEVCVAARAS